MKAGEGLYNAGGKIHLGREVGHSLPRPPEMDSPVGHSRVLIAVLFLSKQSSAYHWAIMAELLVVVVGINVSGGGR